MNRIGSWTVLSLAAILTTPLNGQQVTPDGCSQVWPNSKVNCMNAFMTVAAASDQQCWEMCTQNGQRCRAAQFAMSSRQCSLYDTFIPPATGRRKRQARELFIREKRAGSYSRYYQAPPQQYRPQPQPRPPPGPSVGYRPKTYGPAPAPAPQGYSGGCYGPTVQPVGGYTYAKPSKCVQSTQPPTTPAPQPCPPGQVLRYYVAPGFKLQGSPDSSFTADSEQACVQACTSNRQPSGTAAMCRSADYNTQTKQCQIYSSQSFPPNGTGSPQADESSKHYEKICVDSSLGRCQGPFFLGPQMILIGFAQSVTTASSMTECLALCVNSQSRFGFNCLSGMFYFQETTNNCILNSESKATHPDLYNPESQDRVSYFEPACQTTMRFLRQTLRQMRNRNVIQLDTADFGGWTMCDRMILDHKRFKGCSTFNPNKCTNHEDLCDPKKEQEYDLQIVRPVEATTAGSRGNPSTPEPETTKPTTVNGQGNKPGSSESGPTTKASGTSNSGNSGNGGNSKGGNSKSGNANRGNSSSNAGNFRQNKSKGGKSKDSKNGTKTVKKEEVMIQARDSGGTRPVQFQPFLPTGRCFPLVNPDGTTDCDHGTKFEKDGSRKSCQPEKKDCK